MNSTPKKTPIVIFTPPLNYPLHIRIQREEEIRKQALDDSRKAFEKVSEMLKEGIKA